MRGFPNILQNMISRLQTGWPSFIPNFLAWIVRFTPENGHRSESGGTDGTIPVGFTLRNTSGADDVSGNINKTTASGIITPPLGTVYLASAGCMWTEQYLWK